MEKGLCFKNVGWVYGECTPYLPLLSCSCLDESQQEFQKVLFIPHTFFQGQVEQKWSLPDFCWIPFTKRYTFCFESMLRLWNCEKWKTATHFSFNLTLVKRLRDEKRKIGDQILQKTVSPRQPVVFDTFQVYFFRFSRNSFHGFHETLPFLL